MQRNEITLHLHSQYRGVEQLVARWAHNPKATGSSPVPATRLLKSHILKEMWLFLCPINNELTTSNQHRLNSGQKKAA